MTQPEAPRYYALSQAQLKRALEEAWLNGNQEALTGECEKSAGEILAELPCFPVTPLEALAPTILTALIEHERLRAVHEAYQVDDVGYPDEDEFIAEQVLPLLEEEIRRRPPSV